MFSQLELTNTLFLVVVTVIVSIVAMDNKELFHRLKFNPYMVNKKKEYSRLFSHGLIHSGWLHLGVNMYVLWEFGRAVELFFSAPVVMGEWARYGKFLYVLMYVMALPLASLPALIKRKNDASYNAVGASGAVSAVVFSAILFAPAQKLRFILLPFFDIPAYVLGVGYLIYSYIMTKRGNSRIAHDAHFVGALFGILFPLILNIHLAERFIHQILK
ncbi:MAG: rhomboid family intramembrane serine protease [Bacteroidota bacterium]|nr:rhomboid family intramembrane serine protease [Bacteroidota bacterium]